MLKSTFMCFLSYPVKKLKPQSYDETHFSSYYLFLTHDCIYSLPNYTTINEVILQLQSITYDFWLFIKFIGNKKIRLRKVLHVTRSTLLKVLTEVKVEDFLGKQITYEHSHHMAALRLNITSHFVSSCWYFLTRRIQLYTNWDHVYTLAWLS